MLGWLWVDSLSQLYVVALLLGVAGASFAAALPLAGQWYPKEHQGLAMGIAGAGNSGTVLATLFANRLATHFGSWEVVFGLAIIPIIIVFILFSLFAKNSPNRPEPKSCLNTVRRLNKKMHGSSVHSTVSLSEVSLASVTI